MNEFAKWLLSFDESLLSDSRQATLLQHHVTAGSVREYLVTEILQRFLPANVTLESGMVIDREGRRSKQVDVILFDSRVPRLRTRLGPGLFPVEGVLAAIEIKSAISSTAKLHEALENCASVGECTVTACSGFKRTFVCRHKELVDQGMAPFAAYIRLIYSVFPPTYIFAIEDGLSCSTLREGVDNWFEQNKGRVQTVPVVPRMILAGTSLGVAADGISDIALPNDMKEAIAKDHGPHARVLMGFWPKMKHRISCFASHLLMSINMRMGIEHQYLGTKYEIEPYMPINECFHLENGADREAEFVIWNGIVPRFDQMVSEFTTEGG